MAAEHPSCADFQFNPPEDRLILEYLRPFALGRITGAESVINDDPYRAEPWELLAEHQRDIEESAFFFARKTMVGARRSRTVGENGTWRTQTSVKRAVDDGGGRVVAVFRKTLLSYYYLGGNQIMSTGYVMYEYELYVDSDGSGGGTYDSMLCQVKKSCREVARSNKRKREFQNAGSGIECNPYPYPYPSPYNAAAAAAAAAAASLSGCRYSSAVLCPCEDPVVVDDTDSNRNSMISLLRPPELKASVKSAGEARNFTDRDSATPLPGAPESKAIPETSIEAYAVINRANANPDSVICLSEPPESAALFESARKSPTVAIQHSASSQSARPESRCLCKSACEIPAVAVANQLSASSVLELSEPRSLHESACEVLAVANANSAASQSETRLFESASEATTAASPESANAQSGPPEPKAILEPPSEATTNITSTDLSRSKLQTISQPTFGSEDAAFLVLLPSEASSDAAETPSENEPWQEEPPSDSSNKSETPYSVGELIDILVTADPAATRIFDHLP